MRDKLLLLMKNEGLTSSRLAELLGIRPSGISHILGGRNKPSFDLVQKILRRFPNINPDWLLLDKGEMYRQESTPLPDEGEAAPAYTNLDEQTPLSVDDTPSAHLDSPMTEPTNLAQQIANQHPAPRGGVKRVIVLYNDHTFESYEVSR